MESGSVKERVLEAIQEKLGGGEEVSLDTKLADGLSGDSLDRAEVVMELEDEFDIAIPDELENKAKTVGDVVKYIEDQVKGK